jgi:hypothetical protein
VDDALVFRKFDPQLHPLGHALAIELYGEAACEPSVEDNSGPPPRISADRFGWEFDSEAA